MIDALRIFIIIENICFATFCYINYKNWQAIHNILKKEGEQMKKRIKEWSLATPEAPPILIDKNGNLVDSSAYDEWKRNYPFPTTEQKESK